jgi:Ca2+-transporting ATPase
LAVTIALAFSMFKMIRDNCFVRHLAAAETMGSATCVCTDKTGTLTENRMTVVKLFTLGQAYHGQGSAEQDAQPYSSTTLPETMRDLIAEGVSVNSTCFLQRKSKTEQTIFVGSATEGALLVMCEKFGSDYEVMRKKAIKIDDGELEFSSDRKRMSTMIKPVISLAPMLPKKHRIHVKGASEIMLSLCTGIVDAETKTLRALSATERKEIEDLIGKWAAEGLRTIIMAFRDTDEDPWLDSNTGKPTNLDNNLTFMALCGIKDPIRKEVPMAVKQCQQAGLIVRMVTGDNPITASKIATECGILTENGTVIEGPQFRAMSDEEKRNIIPHLQVLARSSPSDKFTLVSLLQEMGEVVAVTGDVS